MEEKYLVSDILANTNASLSTYAKVIMEAQNPQFRQAIQEIRDSDETFQYELFKVAESKGYYVPAEQATVQEVDNVKNLFANS